MRVLVRLCLISLALLFGIPALAAPAWADVTGTHHCYYGTLTALDGPAVVSGASDPAGLVAACEAAIPSGETLVSIADDPSFSIVYYAVPTPEGCWWSESAVFTDAPPGWTQYAVDQGYSVTVSECPPDPTDPPPPDPMSTWTEYDSANLAVLAEHAPFVAGLAAIGCFALLVSMVVGWSR